jgi:hypothetical protein
LFATFLQNKIGPLLSNVPNQKMGTKQHSKPQTLSRRSPNSNEAKSAAVEGPQLAPQVLLPVNQPSVPTLNKMGQSGDASSSFFTPFSDVLDDIVLNSARAMHSTRDTISVVASEAYVNATEKIEDAIATPVVGRVKDTLSKGVEKANEYIQTLS